MKKFWAWFTDPCTWGWHTIGDRRWVDLGNIVYTVATCKKCGCEVIDTLGF